jgi:hypothetical protein
MFGIRMSKNRVLSAPQINSICGADRIMVIFYVFCVVDVKGAPGRYVSAPISLLPQSYPSYAFERAMLLGWGWRAFEQRGGGVCIVRTAGEDSPPDFNHHLPPSQTTARGRGAGFGSFTPRGKIHHPPPRTHTSLLVPCLPPPKMWRQWRW